MARLQARNSPKQQQHLPERDSKETTTEDLSNSVSKISDQFSGCLARR